MKKEYLQKHDRIYTTGCYLYFDGEKFCFDGFDGGDEYFDGEEVYLDDFGKPYIEKGE